MLSDKNTHKKIRDWFIIQRVRIHTVIKNHKYLSAIVGAFLMTSVIAIIVFASDTDPLAGKVVAQRSGDIGISSTGDANTEETKEVKSFSTIVYNIPFKLVAEEDVSENTSTRNVKVTATLDKNLDANLTTLDANVNYSKKVEGDNQVIELSDYTNLNNTQSIKVYLDIYNVKDGTTISPTITVCDSTVEQIDKCFSVSGDETTVTVRSTEVSLIAKTVPGFAYNHVVDEVTKRYLPFGILVGLNQNDVNDDGTLTGLYINPDITLSLSAVSSAEDTEDILLDQVNVENFYGLYSGETKADAKINILTAKPFPYHNISLASDDVTSAVYNSGEIFYSKCDTSDTTCNLFGTNENVYSLQITGIKTDGRYVEYNNKGFYVDLLSEFKEVLENIFGTNAIENEDSGFLALGSYYVTAVTEPQTSEEDLTRAFKLNVKYKTGDSINDGIAYPGLDSSNLNTIMETTASFAKESDSKLEITDEVAYGEEIILKTTANFQYIDNDETGLDKYNLVGKIPIAAMEYNDGLEPFEMIEYSSDVSENPYLLEINGTSENLESYDVKVLYYACSNLAQCTLDETTQQVYTNYQEFKDAQNEAELNNSKLYLSYIKYSISNIESSALIDFRVRLVTGSNGFGNVTANISTQYISAITSELIREDKQTLQVAVTPYKARLSINIDNIGDDVTINLTDKSSSTIAVYPKVSLPANLINTNSVDINVIDEIIVEVTLPDKINYAPNGNYINPESVSEDGKKLTYILKNQNVNDWIAPIYIDVNYDIDAPSGVQYLISAVIDAKTADSSGVELSDISKIEDRTAQAKLKFINTELLSYSMSTSNTSVLKEEEFDIITKVYNRSDVSQSNMALITVLPYNDQASSSYQGTYVLDLLDIKSSLCTTESYAIVSNSENLTIDGSIVWEECALYEDVGYAGVTAIKTVGINLEPKQFYEQKFNIIPDGNNFSDYYKVESYIVMADNKIKKITPITVSVETIKITGVVWEDFNNDGLMSSDESRIPDVELSLYDSNTDELVQTVLSGKDGSYTFDQIYSEEYMESASFYVVANYNHSKYALTQRNVGDDKSINSSFCLTDGASCITTNDDIYDGDITEGEEESDVPIEDEEEFDGSIEDEETDDEIDDGYEDLDKIEAGDTNLVARTEEIIITDEIRIVGNINLGLSPKKEYHVNLNKYITSATVTNALGVQDTKNFGKVSLAKLDIKDISNVSIKVTYAIELENSGYYPGYVYKVKDIIPDGMEFNPNYSENKGWSMSEAGYLENNLLANEPIKAGEKKYITLSLDLVRKEAGSFVNYAMVDDSDLMIYNGTAGELKNGGITNE